MSDYPNIDRLRALYAGGAARVYLRHSQLGALLADIDNVMDDAGLVIPARGGHAHPARAALGALDVESPHDAPQSTPPPTLPETRTPATDGAGGAVAQSCDRCGGPTAQGFPICGRCDVEIGTGR